MIEDSARKSQDDLVINHDYPLSNANFYKKAYKKKQIVIGNTLSTGMTHYDLWLKKISGKYKGGYHYTITYDGTIYNHFDPKYYSKPLDLGDVDRYIISIALENEGWLEKNFNRHTLINWSGDIYKRGGIPIEIKWRNRLRWAPYSDKQMDSLVKLCKNLCEKFEIPLKTVAHNTSIDNISEKEGIYYRSNYSINYLDVSPAFNFETFKKKIES